MYGDRNTIFSPPPSRPFSRPQADLLLADAVSAVHRLEILHRVPVVLEEDDRVGTGQVESETAHVSRQQQHIDAGVLVELVDNRLPTRVERADKERATEWLKQKHTHTQNKNKKNHKQNQANAEPTPSYTWPSATMAHTWRSPEGTLPSRRM